MWRRVYCIEFDCGLHALFLRHVRDLTSGFVPNMLLYIHEDGRVNPLKRSLWCEWWQWCYIIKLVNMGADAHVCFKVWVPPLIVYIQYIGHKRCPSPAYIAQISTTKSKVLKITREISRDYRGERKLLDCIVDKKESHTTCICILPQLPCYTVNKHSHIRNTGAFK